MIQGAISYMLYSACGHCRAVNSHCSNTVLTTLPSVYIDNTCSRVISPAGLLISCDNTFNMIQPCYTSLQKNQAPSLIVPEQLDRARAARNVSVAAIPPAVSDSSCSICCYHVACRLRCCCGCLACLRLLLNKHSWSAASVCRRCHKGPYPGAAAAAAGQDQPAGCEHDVGQP